MQGQREGEPGDRAIAVGPAFQTDFAVHHFDKAFGDSQAQTGLGDSAKRREIVANKWFHIRGSGG